MHKNSLQLIWASLLTGFVSISYYLSLLSPAIPFAVTISVIILFAVYSYKWVINAAVEEIPFTSNTKKILSYIVFAAGVIIITNKSYYCCLQYGGWDGWSIWNYHAKFLLHEGQYHYLFNSPGYGGHPDYPLFLPSAIAFVWRITGSTSQIVPFIFSFFFTLATPVVIYYSLYRKNIYVAGLVFLLMATKEFYLERGLAQYADLPLGFMFLCAIICISNGIADKRETLITGALLGCCMWLKNEGIMLSVLFIVFNGPSLMLKGKWKYFVGGLILPVTALLLFKAGAPATDLIEGQSASTLGHLKDWNRYKMIWDAMANQLTNNFSEIKIAIILYACLCVAQRKVPAKSLVMLLCCVTGYFFVYVITPRDLEWHLGTSADRVLLQLFPAFAYLLTLQFTNISRSKS